MAEQSDETWPGISDGFAHIWRALIGNSAFEPVVDYQNQTLQRALNLLE